jgi:hypothetical protein
MDNHQTKTSKASLYVDWTLHNEVGFTSLAMDGRGGRAQMLVDELIGQGSSTSGGDRGGWGEVRGDELHRLNLAQRKQELLPLM